jgi:transposase
MRRFVEEADRGQWTLLPECLDDFIDESNPVRVIDVFVDALDLAEMSFEGGGGSMSICWKLCSSALMQTQRPCASVERPSSIPSAR